MYNVKPKCKPYHVVFRSSVSKKYTYDPGQLLCCNLFNPVASGILSPRYSNKKSPISKFFVAKTPLPFKQIQQGSYST